MRHAAYWVIDTIQGVLWLNFWWTLILDLGLFFWRLMLKKGCLKSYPNHEIPCMHVIFVSRRPTTTTHSRCFQKTRPTTWPGKSPTKWTTAVPKPRPKRGRLQRYLPYWLHSQVRAVGKFLQQRGHCIYFLHFTHYAIHRVWCVTRRLR